MRSFSRLVLNEWLKLFKRSSILVPYVILAAYAAIFGYAVFKMGSEFGSGAEFAALAIGMSSAGQVLPLLAIITMAGMVSKEYRMGTIKLLLIRAHSRNKILASKYTAALLFIISLILFTAVAVLVTGTVVYGWGGEAAHWNEIGRSMLFMFIYTTVYVTLTFMIDILTKSSGVTVGIALFCVMMGGLATLLLSKYSFAKFILFANTDLSQFNAGNEPMIPGMTLPFSVSVLIVYVALFLLASFVTFRKRDVS
ncbi:ABC transporter permease [Paenibacillus agaridevorans]|uniref:ABC transporter permease n=1 Tax=Paenibacillus agaridevorans TaxID=171404 RepID=UPI0015E80188|nr:DUF2705 family protein [Paenibacillus agaridevorans]